MSDGQQQDQDIEHRVAGLEFESRVLKSWLGVELGYAKEAPGNVNRIMNETNTKADEALQLLRGKGNELGMIGWVNVITKSWWLLVSAVAGLAGFVLGQIFPQ